jgi:hypothetical protein
MFQLLSKQILACVALVLHSRYVSFSKCTLYRKSDKHFETRYIEEIENTNTTLIRYIFKPRDRTNKYIQSVIRLLLEDLAGIYVYLEIIANSSVFFQLCLNASKAVSFLVEGGNDTFRSSESR